MSAWSPALRDGSAWTEYLKFNFGGTARINKVRIGTPIMANMVISRSVYSVRIESGSNCDTFKNKFETRIPTNNMIEFQDTVVASVIKITILGLDSFAPDLSPIAVNE